MVAEDRQTDRQRDGQTDGQKDRQTDGQTYRHTDTCTNRRTLSVSLLSLDEFNLMVTNVAVMEIYRQTDITNGQTDTCTDRQTPRLTTRPMLPLSVHSLYHCMSSIK